MYAWQNSARLPEIDPWPFANGANDMTLELSGWLKIPKVNTGINYPVTSHDETLVIVVWLLPKIVVCGKILAKFFKYQI